MSVGKVVIVGAGQAGAWAARNLREGGFEGSITLVGEEPHAPYERPPLSKEIMLGESTADELTLLPHDEIASLNIDARLGQRVAAIDRTARSVKLANGDTLPYDKLVICTGGRARMLNINGLDHPHVHTLRTLDDALRLKAALSDAPGPVLVVGGGWIGLEIAASARSMGCTVTVLEATDRLCQRSVAPDVSAALLQLHESQQVDVRLSTQLSAVQTSDNGLTATLSSGETLSCRHLILAAGLIANDELAQEAGLSCANGILVDDRCRSSDPDILAAGDVAVLETSMPGVKMRLESWQNAQDQGMAVAASILDQDLSYRPVPLVWSQQFDQFIQIVGHVGAGTSIVERKTASGSLRFYLADDSTIVAAIGMNAGRDYRFARQLVERGSRISAEELADTSKPLNKLTASTAAA